MKNEKWKIRLLLSCLLLLLLPPAPARLRLPPDFAFAFPYRRNPCNLWLIKSAIRNPKF
jgi:hypothetical protein